MFACKCLPTTSSLLRNHTAPLPLQMRSSGRYLALNGVLLVAMAGTYYGVGLSVGALKGNLHVVFVVTALSELPAYPISAYAIDRVGRKCTVLVSQLLGGVFCALVSFAKNGWMEVRHDGGRLCTADLTASCIGCPAERALVRMQCRFPPTYIP